MKMLIFSALGGIKPDIVMKKLRSSGASYPECRTGNILNILEEISVKTTDVTDGTYFDWCKNNPERLIKSPNGEEVNYYGWCSASDTMSKVTVVDVDVTKRWVIKEYLGMEELQELPEYTCISSRLNLYGKVKR